MGGMPAPLFGGAVQSLTHRDQEAQSLELHGWRGRLVHKRTDAPSNSSPGKWDGPPARPAVRSRVASTVVRPKPTGQLSQPSASIWFVSHGNHRSKSRRVIDAFAKLSKMLIRGTLPEGFWKFHFSLSR